MGTTYLLPRGGQRLVDITRVDVHVTIQSEVELTQLVIDSHVAEQRPQRPRPVWRPLGQHRRRPRLTVHASQRQRRVLDVDPESDVAVAVERSVVD